MSPDTLSTVTMVLFGLLVIVFLVALVLSFKTWKVYTILLVLLVFAGSATFAYLSIRTLKIHQAWREEHRKYQIGLQIVEDQVAATKNGRRDDEGNDTEFGIRQRQQQLHHAMMGRGLLWQPATPEKMIDQNAGVVQISVPAGGAIIEVGKIVYVFEQSTDWVDDLPKVRRYVGQFTVTSKADDANTTLVDLTPKHKPTASQLKRITDRDGPWGLYEIMPQDSHFVFEVFSAAGGQSYEPLSDDQLKSLLPAEVVSEYIRDGKPALDDDPPERIWIRATFQKEYEFKTADDPNIKDWNFRDKVDREFNFVPGDKVVVDLATFNKYLKPDDVARQDQRIYVRELRDYEHLLNVYERERARLGSEEEELIRNRDFVVEALAKARSVEQTHQTEHQRLEADQTGFQQELKDVKQYAGTLQKHYGDVLAELKRLHLENQSLAGELAQLQQQAREKVRQRATAKPAAGPADEKPDL